MTKEATLQEFIAKRIRLLRLSKDMTQEELAEKAGLGFNYIYRLENKNINVKVETIDKIMTALNIDMATFFDVDSSNDYLTNNLVKEIEQLPIEKREQTIIAFQTLIDNMK